MEDIVFHELLQGIKEVLGDLKTDQKDIQKDISLIKEDLKVHILRTDILQEELKNTKKQIDPVLKDSYKIKGAAALLGLLLTVLTILSIFHKI